MTLASPRGRLQGGPRTRISGGMRDANHVRPQTYEITFTGEAGPSLRAEFDDCEVTTGSGTTTLRAELPDQAALLGLVLRVTAFRAKVIHLRLVAPLPGHQQGLALEG
jgi:hypothetical protein